MHGDFWRESWRGGRGPGREMALRGEGCEKGSRGHPELNGEGALVLQRKLPELKDRGRQASTQ